MWRVTWREVRAHWVRFGLSTLAVVLGVAFVAGTFSLRAMLSATFDSIVSSSLQGDVYVRGANAAGDSGPGGFGGTNYNAVPLSLAEELSGVTGVRAALPDLQGPAVLVGKSGTAVINGQAPTYGIGLAPGDPSVTIAAGREPAAAGEIALDAATLKASGLAVGDATKAIIGDALTDVTVVGEANLPTATAGATLVFLDQASAEAAYAPTGTVATIAVYAEPGVSADQLVADLTPHLPGDATAVTGESVRKDASAAIQTVIGFLGTFLLVFAAIALFVGAFIIGNTFAMSVRQRQREFALLRAVGASPGQVFAVVVGQAALVGLIGSAIGLVSGYFLVDLIGLVLRRFGMTMGEQGAPSTTMIVVCLAAGTVVSMVAAALPARRAALTPPVEAMRDDVTVTERSLRGRTIAGTLLLLAGAALTAYAVFGDLGKSGPRGPWLGGGAAAVLLGMLVVSPGIARTVLGVLALPFSRLRPVGRLARGNVTRNPRRTASTAGALMIGMALVAACAVLAASATASTRSIVEGEVVAPLMISSATRTIAADALPLVEQTPGVARVDTIHSAAGQLGSGADAPTVTLTGLSPDAVPGSVDARALSGTTAGLAAGTALVSAAAAQEHDWKVGDAIDLSGPAGSLTVTVAAVTDSQLLGTDVDLVEADLERLVPVQSARLVAAFVHPTSGTDVTGLQDTLRETLKPYVVLDVITPEQMSDQIAAQVNQAMMILYALLGLSVVIAVLGIVNTLALSVIERTREIGLTRAVGLGRFQLAATIVIEAVLTAVFGTIVGLVVGVAMAAAVRSVYADQGLRLLEVPTAQLLWILGLSVVVGVLAAVGPAIRAARLPVLRAIAQE